MSRRRSFPHRTTIALWALLLAAAALAAHAQLTMRPSDLSTYDYRILDTCKVRLYLDSFGRGWLHDSARDLWFRVPQMSGVEPYYCRTSDSLALVYALSGAAAFDSTLPGEKAWVQNSEVTQSGGGFTGFSRGLSADYAARCNDNLALAVGASWFCVYDRLLHRWVNVQAQVDTTTGDVRYDVRLTPSGASVRSRNGPAYSYALGSGSWTK